MTPEDWRRGMENEADSVEDRRWAEQTRLAAARLTVGQTWGLALLVFAGLAAVQVLLVQFVWGTHPPAQLWPGMMGLAAVVGAGLGFLRLPPMLVMGAALVYLPAAWLVTLALQGALAGAALPSPGFPNEGVTVLAVITANGAALVHFLRHRRPPSHRRKMTP